MARPYILLVAVLAGLAACAAPAPAAGGPAPATATATAATATIAPGSAKQTLTNGAATCDFDVTWLTVSGIAADATATANAALDLTPGPADCEESATVTGGLDGPVLNEHGVLSTAYHVERFVHGTAHPARTAVTFVIDLATGEEIPLDDVLTDQGRAAFVAACRKGLDPQLADADPCDAAFAGGGPDAPYTVNRDGLVAHVYTDVPYAVQALAHDGVPVPWAALGDGLRPGTPVAALAGR